MCGGLWVLPRAVTLKGYSLGETVVRLTWIAPGNTKGITYKVERKDENTGFEQIGQVQGSSQSGSYSFVDNNLKSGSAFYRLKIAGADNQFTYSNTVQINTHPDDRISVYPNPANKVLSIDIRASRSQRYQLIIYTIAGQILYTGEPVSVQSSTLVYYRDASVTPGLYFLKVKNLSSGESRLFKVLFGER
jgi:hypothetical protein